MDPLKRFEMITQFIIMSLFMTKVRNWFADIINFVGFGFLIKNEFQFNHRFMITSIH